MAAKPKQATPQAPVVESLRVRVRDGRIGYYNNVRWRQGQVFKLNKKEDFSTKWMEWAPAARLDRPMSGPQALDKAVQAIKGGQGTNGLVTDSRDRGEPFEEPLEQVDTELAEAI